MLTQRSTLGPRSWANHFSYCVSRWRWGAWLCLKPLVAFHRWWVSSSPLSPRGSTRSYAAPTAPRRSWYSWLGWISPDQRIHHLSRLHLQPLHRRSSGHFAHECTWQSPRQQPPSYRASLWLPLWSTWFSAWPRACSRSRIRSSRSRRAWWSGPDRHVWVSWDPLRH